MSNSPLTLKGKSTIYTDEKRAALLYNAKHDEAVRKKAEDLAAAADKYLDKVDFIYDSIVAEGVFRYYFVGSRPDPKHSTCRYCGTDIAKIAGLYGWITDPFNSPWKIECPACHRKFPSNDFGSYYKLGLTKDGHFDHEKAKKEHIKLFGGLENVGYLKNELYPEMDEHIDENGNVVNKGVHGWGVDDGTGYHTVNENGFEEVHSYIAFYLHTGVWGGTGKNNTVRDPLKLFRDAYLYTGDIKYARAGAKILDRIADFYPEYDWYIWHENRGDSYHGKILDPVWECGLSREFSTSYDAFYPAYDDEELIEYLSRKAKEHGTDHINPKNTGDHLRKNAEDGILRAVYSGAVRNKIAGNFGMDQTAVAIAAVVLNTMPETGEWLDWAMRPSAPKAIGENPPDRAGGNVYAQLVDVVDRDGMGNESSPSYNSIWINCLFQMADALVGYELYPEIDLFKNPKFMKMFLSHLPLIMGGNYTAQIGDAGAYGSTGVILPMDRLLSAYIATKEPIYARLMYFMNGGKSAGLRYPDTIKDPERLESEVQSVIDTYGEYKLGSTLQSGYGLAALRDGEITEEKNTKRDFWMYMGTTTGHAHGDGLNLGITAYGLNVAPELGYPKNTGAEANRIQWISSSISHNTVVVNEKTQNRLQDRGFPLHFDDSGKVKIMDADKSAVYDEAEIYRRTVLMINANENESYGVDFFRIKGGNDHLYSFHSQSEKVSETVGLELIPQNGGTYASPDVPYGQDPSPLSGKSWNRNVFVYPEGYTWLDNVTKELSPEKDFSVDFEVTDYRNTIKDSSGLHLRLTMLNDAPLQEVSIVNGYPVANANNPDTNIKYLLARRKYNEGEASDTVFTTVIEPYKNKRYISSVEAVSVQRKDGKDLSENEVVKALKVSLTNGRTDIIVLAYDNTSEYIVDGAFSFKGFAGVISLENGKEDFAYICDGEKIGSLTADLKGAYTGTVVDFTKVLSLENTIEISCDIPESKLSDIKGKWIYVDNDKVQNGAYMIHDAKLLPNGNILLDLGDTSIVRRYKDKFSPEAGFEYNISEGQAFRIPLSFSKKTF